ncbi:TRAP transporter large permease subunit [Microvirga sp. M2]|uniref:TRAP transporter large permease subunit n=1 Tax=Microvirga sp. M2 TaxID=3073270 RepID=UPI0039C18A9D
MSWIGLALLPFVGAMLVLTGLPAFLVLIGAAGLGAIAAATGGDGALLTALPGRLVGLLENDLLQALPLFVFIGALLNRLPLAETLFRTGLRLTRGTPAGPSIVALGLGALLAPMNGSVAASVTMLSRAVYPRLLRHGVEPVEGLATVAVASTLGVVVPPSLVLILLGDAMMGAHTIASNAMGRSERIINTQDIFRGVLGSAILFVALCVIATTWIRRRGKPVSAKASRTDLIVSILSCCFIVGILGGVAAGLFYAVEAAALGATVLLLSGLLVRRLDGAALAKVLAETLALTGALFALLLAATTFTLVLRSLGTDHLLSRLIADLPGGELGATLVVLAILAASAFVLDAFEIIFVVVPIVMPGLLMRTSDAVWVSVLAILTLQASFLLPPLGYAVMMARSAMADPVRTWPLMRALVPYLAVHALVVAVTVAVPGLVHLGASPQSAPTDPSVSNEQVEQQLQRLIPDITPDLSLPNISD